MSKDFYPLDFVGLLLGAYIFFISISQQDTVGRYFSQVYLVSIFELSQRFQLIQFKYLDIILSNHCNFQANQYYPLYSFSSNMICPLLILTEYFHKLIQNHLIFQIRPQMGQPREFEMEEGKPQVYVCVRKHKEIYGKYLTFTTLLALVHLP